MPDLISRFAAAPSRAGGIWSDFDLNQMPVPDRDFKQAAVLIGVDADHRVILTRRAAHLKHHAGQIAFPGGRRDPGDADAVATALREAQEEIGLPQDAVRVLGQMPEYLTASGYRITPVLAQIGNFDPIAEPGEVDEIFRVPLAAISDPARFRIHARDWSGRSWKYCTVPYGPYYIWGVSARILAVLAEAMQVPA